MEKIFQETRASTNHSSNNPGKARLRNGAEILVLFPHLCTGIEYMIDLIKKPWSICQ